MTQHVAGKGNKFSDCMRVLRDDFSFKRYVDSSGIPETLIWEKALLLKVRRT
jgi:hypothetical protein